MTLKRVPLRRSPMRRITPKARARITAWQVERDAHLAAHPRCEVSGLGVFGAGICDGPLEVHHRMPRSAGGTRGETGPLLTVCRRHHAWIEANRTAAKTLGLLVRRGVSK